ncbi:LamG-like jellyroll fold domain-containing protein [Winogradskyella sp.]|uniref:LamG-like jellyroll fold domain-containing protein n=4 Tax=Winogradskyella sp. TaxID=1883156 RepID=UPI003559A1AA
MNKFLLLNLSFMLFLSVNLNAQSGIFECYVVIDSGFGNNYYDLNPHTQTPNFDFNGANLGTFQSADTFILNGGQNNIFKCGSDDVTSGWLHYRIYPSGSPSGAFLSIDLSSNVQNFSGAACGGTGDNQYWSTTNANINILSGLTSGVDYTIEVYTTADFSVGGTPNPFPHTVNNGGANFSATFRLDNPPIASCTNYMAQLDNFGNASITAANIDNGSSDDFGIASMTVSPNTFNCSNIGSNTVTLTVTDTNGQTDTCIATVTVEDNIDPTIPTLADVTGECSATATAPTTTDNCSGTITGTTSDPLTYSTQGTFVINWTFDDGNGNSIIVPQNVIVDDVTDPTAPTLADVTGECSATATAPTTTDNCSGTLTGTTSDPLTYSTQGTFVINWTFDDGNGNSIIVPQNVIVDDVTDPTSPTLADVTGECSATATAPTTTDNCSGTITGTTTDPLTYSTQGSFVINWTFDDGNGNVIVVPQNVIVDDVTDPTIPTLADVTGECSATATAPTTTDNCSGTITGTTTDPLTYSTQGSFVINWTFDDGNVNVIVVPQNVIVGDVTDPTIPTLADVTGECSATATAPTTTDNCSGTITGTTTDPLTYSTQGTFVINWTFDDGNGNSIIVPQNVIVDDVTDPTTPNLPIITDQCSATVPVPSTSDGCSGTITGTTTDPLTYNSQGSYAVNWTFDDGNGNIINVVQNVVIDDTIDPIAICNDLTIQLDDTTGTATIIGSQLDIGSSDNCGIVNFSLSQSVFDCTDIGTNIVVLTVDDGNGNTDTCTATVTVTSPNIDGGTALGYLNNTETVADSDNIIEVTACPDEPQNATINLSGHSGNVAFWQTSNNGGITWSNVANTTTTFYYANIVETTLVRAIVQIGSCQAASTIVVVAVVPPDVPPTIIGPSEYTICLGEAIIVEAESSFSVNTELNNGGQFNEANLPGWLVDGADGVSGWNASGSNTSPTPWRGISNGNGNNSSNITEGVRYKNQGGGKFAITYGDFNGADPSPPVTTLETAVFNTLGLTNASIDFQSAYYLQSGASGIVELSVDGGTTYPVTLMSFNGPGDSGGFVNQGNGGNNVPTVNLQDGIHSVSLDLSDYIGLTDLRVRFTFTSTYGSSWAIDGITLPQAPVDEVIEWEDGTGTVVTTGSTTTITPVTPGIQTYGVTSLINGCRADGPEGTEFIDVNASLAYAGEDITQIIGECGEDVDLNAYDNSLTAAQNIANGVANAVVFATGTYPGTGEAGVWSANLISSCGGNYSFSDLGSPTSKFSADPGTYEVKWTVPAINCSDTIIVTIESCPTIDFDGVNDYITFKDNYDLSNEFSIEVWIKPESVTGIQTLFSKRDANDLTSGYDLRLTGATVQFNWNSTETIQSSYPISTDRWYHIAVTNNNGSYRLYIDGIEVSAPIAGIAPTTNTMASIIGAMDQNNNPPNKPVNYYNGWMDELRIWSTALAQDQIRHMMNQEIDDNTLVRGVVVPLDVTGLPWVDLEGYYRMDVLCGKLLAYKGLTGLLRNMDSAQQETAPIPYTSRVDGQEWATDNTWTNFNVWDAPNSIGIDNATPIDWNIVEISHDIFSGDKDITVLGLISDTPNKELEIRDPLTPNDQANDGQMLRVTHYLELDGNINLVGQSQLIQDFGSVLATSSTGSLERHQQGTLNATNYNYWSSPVGTLNAASNNVAYTVPSVLRDGTSANSISALAFNDGAIDPIGSAGNLTMAGYWLWYYNNRNDVEDEQTNYDAWQYLGSGTAIDVGLGYTMKGSGLTSPFGEQNWAFVGKPNNGDNINFSINADHQTLLGNPYPSALDSHKFIDDNIPGSGTGAIDGTLYFWEHYPENQTHYLEEYEGGYATLTKLGSVPAAVISSLISGNTTANPKRPGRYIPVAQGFFVQAPEFGSSVRTINFNNGQRIFYREGVDLETPSGDDSLFFRNGSNPVSSTDNQNNEEQIVRRIRFLFNSQGYSRELLLGFTSNNDATDDVDYGYDAELYDAMPDDISWKIADRDFVIQGVGEFDSTKIYTLNLSIVNDGEIALEAIEIENFETDIDVFLYDSVLDSYTNLYNNVFTISLGSGEYMDRFFIVFESQELGINGYEENSIGLYYLDNTNEIYVNSINTSDIRQIEIFNILGQSIKLWDDISSESNTELRIPVTQVPHGAYVVKLKLESGSILSRKVVIKQ